MRKNCRSCIRSGRPSLGSWNGNIVLLLLSCEDCLCLLDGFIDILYVYLITDILEYKKTWL